MNSVNHLRKKEYQSYVDSEHRKTKQYLLTHLKGQFHPNTKTKDITKTEN